MTIVGCDSHPSLQQIAVFALTHLSCIGVKLVNGERFYRRLSSPALVGVEACSDSWTCCSGWGTKCGLEMRPRSIRRLWPPWPTDLLASFALFDDNPARINVPEAYLLAGQSMHSGKQ